jgi:hypothetical protein
LRSPTPAMSRASSSVRLLLETVLDRIASSSPGGVAVRTHTVRDPDLSHYLLIAARVAGDRRIYRTMMHIAVVGEHYMFMRTALWKVSPNSFMPLVFQRANHLRMGSTFGDACPDLP